MNQEMHQKVKATHLERNAYLYIRQSTLRKRRTSMPKQSLTKSAMVRIYNKTVVRWQQLCY